MLLYVARLLYLTCNNKVLYVVRRTRVVDDTIQQGLSMTYAIGDIHGEVTLLRQLLARLPFRLFRFFIPALYIYS
jgi:hypothetical protein